MRQRFAWCLVLMCAACSQPSGGGPAVDSNTNWLRACAVDDDCGNSGLSCICGRCTLRCEPDGCIFLEAGAVCAPSASASCPLEGDEGVCLPQDAPDPGQLLPPDATSEPGPASALYPGPCSTTLSGRDHGTLIKHYRYSEEGHLLEVRIDEGADGHIDRREQFHYDSLGRVGQLLVVEPAQHEVLSEEHWSYSGDRREPALITYDDKADGSVEMRHVLRYNAQGLLELRRREQMLPQVQVLSVERLVYDARQRLSERHIDEDVDGHDDVAIYLDYDEADRLVGQRVDRGLDGRLDAREHYDLDVAGNRLETRFDDDNDGHIDRVETADFSCF